ncbi:hypothetical protein GCM10009738_67790 [Kitasatospora viridis]
MIGLVTVHNATIVLATIDNLCKAYVLPEGSTPDSTPQLFAVGAQRPEGNYPKVDPSNFAGAVITENYSQGSASASPYFDYLTTICSEHAVLVSIEGIPPGSSAQSTGASVRTWESAGYLFIAAGDPKVIHS